MKTIKTLSLSDYKLRLFVDTNVLVDYFDNFNEKKSVAFFSLFRNAKRKNIELITSDYVLWEFYCRARKELYAKKLVANHNYGFIHAAKEAYNEEFNKSVKTKCMRNFGDEITGFLRKMEEGQIIYCKRLLNEQKPRFSETIDSVLQCSKFSYKDAIVLVSAQFTGAHYIVTNDHDFKSKHLNQVKEAMNKWPINPGNIEWKRPEELSTLKNLNCVYKKWFENRNKDKISGSIADHLPRAKVFHIKCKKGCGIKISDTISVVKFFGEKFRKFDFTVKTGHLWSATKDKPIKKGCNVSVKLPSNPPGKNNWRNGSVFISGT